MSSDIAISVQNLTKTYRIFDHPGDRIKQALTLGRVKFHREFTALKDVSFDIKKGETVGIIGRNGSGKSTLLQLICGILKPTSGSVTVNGRVSALLELGSGFNPEFTGRENIYFQGAIMGFGKEEMDPKVENIISFAEVGEFIDEPIRTYSSGMFVRLAFSVAAHMDPDILIVDEALAVGDAAFQFRCSERIRQMMATGVTLIMVSHDMGIIKSFCSRVLYLEKGAEKLIGPAELVSEHYFLDIRQQQMNAPEEAIVWKTPVTGSVKGLAFGTEQGKILSTRFLSGETDITIEGNTQVTFQVDIEYDASVRSPYLSVFLQDQRLIEVSGKEFALHSEGSGRIAASLDISFHAKLKPGSYFLTIRLETRDGRGGIFPLDKQTGALSLTTTSYNPHFLGLVDIGMQLAHPLEN